MFPPRAVTPTIPVDLPVLMANYAQPMIAWRMLDIIESHAELLPVDRGDWVEFFTNRFMGEDRSPGAYAMTRISVGAALAMWELQGQAAPSRRNVGESTHSLHASQLFTTITPEDLTVTSIMCRQDTVDFLAEREDQERTLTEAQASSADLQLETTGLRKPSTLPLVMTLPPADWRGLEMTGLAEPNTRRRSSRLDLGGGSDDYRHADEQSELVVRHHRGH